jgi:tRNA A-37 threonylcarbamoyl transferase component Bud32
MRWFRGVSDDLLHKRGVRGFRWTIAEGAAQWLPATLLDNPEEFFLKYPPQKILKESPVRTVSIISGPHGELFLKRYKIRGVREQLKYIFFPSKAQKEWEMACLARRSGIPIPLAVAIGERHKGGMLQDAYLITQAISPSLPLIELISEGDQKDLLFRAARLLRQIHEAGLFHQDLHAGNILVGMEEKKLYLIDLHRSRSLGSVSKQRRLWNLAQFFYSLKKWLSAEDKKTFLQWYDEEENTFTEGLDAGLRKIKRLEERIYQRHMKSRTKRCLKDSGGFFVGREEGWRIWARRGWKVEELLTIIERHEDILAKGKKGAIKDDRRAAIALFNYKKTRICVKEYRYKGALQQLKEVFRRSKARRGWLMGNGLVVRGIEGITPQALLERRRWGVLQEAFLLMESPPGYVELDRYMVRHFGASHYEGDRKGAFLNALAGFMAELYLLNICHKDLKTCNIMVREEQNGWRFSLVDMDDLQLDKKIHKRRLLKALIQLNTSTPLFIGMKDRIGFLIQYLQLIRRDDIRDIAKRVIKGSGGRQLVYVAPHGDVIMDVDWEQLCGACTHLPSA